MTVAATPDAASSATRGRWSPPQRDDPRRAPRQPRRTLVTWARGSGGFPPARGFRNTKTHLAPRSPAKSAGQRAATGRPPPGQPRRLPGNPCSRPRGRPTHRPGRDWRKTRGHAKFRGADRAVHQSEVSNDGTHETKPALLRRRENGAGTGSGCFPTGKPACTRSSGARTGAGSPGRWDTAIG